MKILNNNKLNISNMNLNLNGKYTVNSYMDYNYFGYFSITFDKEILDNVEIEEGLIIPPYTGR
jgi:ABC-type thiamine transport system substrate-binding protein